MNSFFDGQYMPLSDVRVSPLDFGFIHSHATYDVMRNLTFFDLHYDRFSTSCKFYGFTPPAKDDLLEIINNLLDEDDMFIWLVMWKGTPPSGSPRDLTGPDHFLVYTKPHYPISDKPVSLTIVDTLPRSPGYQEYKNFSWIELTHAQQNSGEFDTAIIRNKDGFINEGPGFGICFVKKLDRGWSVWTPKTDVLPSVTVDVVEEMCNKRFIEFVRADFKTVDFDECFICSTSGGITPVSRIDDTKYESTLTKQLRKEYDNLCRHGRSGNRLRGLDPIAFAKSIGRRLAIHR